MDVGAGIGLVGEFLCERRPDVTYRFVEPIPFLDALLVQRHGAAADAKDDQRYEGVQVVALLDVLEHQRGDRAFMSELVERLDSGTTIVVTVPACMSLWSEWDIALGHYRRYDRGSFRRAIEGLPLEVVELDYLFPELVPLGFIRKVRMRRHARAGAAPDEFPELPRVVNELLYVVGTASLRLRRIWPVGSSMLAVLRTTT